MLEDPSLIPSTEGRQPVVSLIGVKKVPNVIPETVTVPYRLAIIGEAPGEDEEAYGIPFCGASGRLLDEVLQSSGILRSQCFIGNVCQYRPPGNKIQAWGLIDERVVEGREELLTQLIDWQPNCVLCLGNTPMWALTGHPFGVKGSTHSISDYVCFITPTTLGTKTLKLVGSYHPAFILREYSNKVFLSFATRRAREEAQRSEIVLPIRNFELDLPAYEVISRLDNWPAGLECSIDIEGGLDGWICISFVASPDTGFIVYFTDYSTTDKGKVYQSVSRLLYRDDVPKVLQNSLYEGFVLQYGFNMIMRNVSEDTMLKWWEIYSELPKGLDTVASICTREPQWKFLIAYSAKEKKRRAKLPDYDPRKEAQNKNRACCIDSAVTLESSRAMDSMLSNAGRRHYQFNLDLLAPLRYMELRGFNYDKQGANDELAQTNIQICDVATRLEQRVGYDLRGTKGSISSTKLARCLYEEKSYPVQKKGRGENAKITTDVEALLNLQFKFPKDAFLSDVLLHRKLESLRETLQVSTDPDGRVRCGYNLVGTETGRLTCYTSPTGSGANLQTITKKLRKLYLPDPGFWLFQCDLSGADGWTVAARCLSLGDPTMWDDYCSGLKPAKILAMMFQHGVESTMCSRDELRTRCADESVPGGACDQDAWLYFACKRIQHATNYGVQPKTAATQIMQDSYKVSGKAIYVDIPTVTALQRFYLIRYPGVQSYHAWGEREVLAGHNSVDAAGHERKFFGRRRGWNPRTRQVEADHDTWKEFLAHEPQANTTYATNLAMWKLWHDKQNRFSNGRTLKIMPMHQVHDALLGQFKKGEEDFAIERIRTYFQNELIIAGTKVTIPFEGSYGPNWYHMGEKYGGGKI